MLEGFFDGDVRHSDLGVIAKGTRSIETFFLDRWYNYFVFFEPNGQLRNHYINISMPPRISENAIDYVDLDIDIIIWPAGKIEILDTEEFEQNAVRYSYPESIIGKVLELKQHITSAPSNFITLAK